MKYILVKTARFIHEYHKGILLFSIALSVIFMSVVFNIDIKTDLFDVLPANKPSMKVFNETFSDIQKRNALTVVIDMNSDTIEEHIGMIDALGIALSSSPLIKDVDYNVFSFPWEFMIRNFPLYLDEEGIDLLKDRLSAGGMASQIRQNYLKLVSPFSSPADIKIISDDPLNIFSLLKASAEEANSSGLDLSTGYYISEDRKSAFIFITPEGSSRDISFLRSLKQEVQGIVEATMSAQGADDINIGYTGVYAVSWEVNESIKHDMLFSVFLTIMLVFIVFRFIYRGSLAGFTIILLTIIVALLFTLSSSHILFGGLNMITALVSAMLIGLGIDFALHIYDRYLMEFTKDRDALLSLERTLLNTGRSVVTSGITTAFAFFSIVVTSFKGLYELGIIAGIGIISCVLSSFFVMGSLLIWISTSRFSKVLSLKNNDLLEKTVPSLLMKNRKFLLVSIGLIILLSSSGLWKLEFTSDVSQIGLRNSQAIDLQEAITAKNNDIANPLIVTYKGSNTITNVFDEMEKRLSSWEGEGIIGKHASLSKFIPPAYKQGRVINRMPEIHNDADRIQKSFLSAMNRYGFVVKDKDISYITNVINSIKNIKVIGPDELPGDLRSKSQMFYNSDSGRLSAYIYPVNEEWARSDIDIINNDLEGMGEGWHLTGWQLLSEELKRDIVKESMIASVISFLFVSFFVFFHFRRLRVIFIVQLPLLLSFLLTLGIMGISGIAFNYINISAIAIIFGISIDYGVYIMQALMENRRRGDDVIIKHVYKNILICSLTTIVGFGSLMTTNFRGIASLGTVIVIGVLSCLLTSTLISPLSEYFLNDNE